jgi:hypothetical protein
VIANLWRWHRRTVLVTAIAAVCVVVAATVTVVGVSAGNAGQGTVTAGHDRRSSVTTPAKNPTSPGRPGAVYRPRYIVPPATARQDQLASALASAESPQQIAAVEAIGVPAGGYSTAYQAIPAVDTTDEVTYADAWVGELLDIDYRSQSRTGLLAWAVEGEAANTLPGVPTGVADKALYASLADPTLGGQQGSSPVPSPARWAADAKAEVTQRVLGIETSVDPQWTSLVGEGFVPTDPLLAFVDVSGTLMTYQTSTAAGSKVQFKLVLTVGSALHHPGYGAVTVDDWSVT